jgi:hypothetical protein
LVSAYWHAQFIPELFVFDTKYLIYERFETFSIVKF